MGDKWGHVARLIALHGEVCSSLALLRCRVQDRDRGRLEEVASRLKELALALEGMTRARGAPRQLRQAARRHAASVAELLA